MRPVAVINPMQSRRPTGIGIAGDAIAQLLPAGVALRSERLDRWFVRVNDGWLPGPVRALARLGLAQVAAWFFPRESRLLFTSHHAPLWRSGRQALVVYDTIPLQFPAQAPAQTSYYRRGLPRALRCADRVVAISAAVRDEFAALGHVRAEDVTVIPAWSAAVDGRRTATGVARGKHELLVVGARYPHKNIDVVLAALELLNRSAPAPWRLTLAGADRALWGRAWGGLEQFERRGWVSVIPRVADDELARLYDRASVLIYPSLAEGQGLPPLEALAAGCAAVCSDLPVLRETCGEAVRYFPARDAAALAAAIEGSAGEESESAGARRMAVGRERLARFGREALARRWGEFLERWP